MTKPWFEEWFDSRYYHILYSHRDDGEAQDFMLRLLNFLLLEKNSQIIDIGCGRGRHARFLSDQGYKVIGIDIAPTNIDYAKQFEGENLHFFCFDKRKIFKKASFDIALNLFTSYGFLKNREELQVAMISMSENLKKGGKIVIDYMNAEMIKHQSFHKEKIHIDGIEFTINKRIEGHQIIKEIGIEEGEIKLNFYEKVHLITFSEFEDLFESASLKILHTFGDYQLNKFDPKTSPRLILIAEKV